ncbi:MAG TPA: hypothetical protein PKE57_11715 [Cellvibrionaceae bacterium]|nr:hypothetical protein [Cellvibrionaceae bacterium]HMW50342.1 hypothetical protein [Cellvibrionaceae bacterium]HMW73849.1 hypothetical protein [Cellvibrionaceae bacterium]HMY37949.1 hypothetical protein [Marinagarivorans sp.]HNG60730.1 hypothetical protein [Cellvibrionaceae bacterium]
MLEIITHTPTWVFGLFIGLVLLGVQQRKNRQVKKPLAFILPLGMLALSFTGVWTSFGFMPSALSIWGAGLIMSAFAVARIWPVRGLKYNQTNNSFFIPGSWAPFSVIMLIFFAKYSVGVLHGISPAALDSTLLKLAFSLVYGLSSGYFVGRALCLWQAFSQKRAGI